ncbi:uncharacterized protein LOC120779601 isoform X1 [Bactrocera tryoni]|uniref:uncharacterized protein LOC120779601 isoform X1 n=2 Tax=Bactrocera tryoni TaxID=59916 RepID=UPI001A971B13|nr:uncharacterized protein LOC120779601 isoform X1 [Bactrocera tryoni]XP_039967881.1 uncharacterized protein LOC120779601 isoform X1 [Bactrocera tryoni]
MALINNSNMNDSDEERDLTSLSWLMELRNQNFSWTNDMQQVNLNGDEMSNRHNIKWYHEESGGQKDAYDKTSLFKNKDNSNDKTNYVFNNDHIVPAISNGTLFNEFDKQQKEHSSSSDIDKNITKRNCIGKSIEKTCRKSFKGMQSFQQQQLKVQIKRATPIERYEIFMEKVKRVFVEYQKSATNYQTNTTEKPPFNYSHIIGMAMLENGRVTLQQICSWIETKFAYFRVRKKWNNSIRHNLSLHQCFRKVDRKKFEKGKGGYWELGVDPRKCDRKRIRNRKNAQHKIRQMQHQYQHQPQKLQKYPLSKNKNKITQETKAMVVLDRQSPINTSYKELQKLQTESYYSDCAQQQVNEMHTVCPANSSSSLETDHATGRHLLLDELDIQQNIDVVSCCQQSQQEHKIFITSMAEEIPAAINSVPNDNSPKTIELLQNSKLQQYQLGTVIISAPTAKYGNISDFAASTGSINCFINGDYIDDKTHKLQQNFICIKGDDIQTTCQNVTSYADKDVLSEKSSKPNPHTNTTTTFTPFIPYSASTSKYVPSVFINSVEQENNVLISHSIMPNVVVEQLLQPSGLQYTLTPSMATPEATIVTPEVTTNGMNNINSEQNNQQLLAIDSIRPYIDGIEEAFQYLRSMDNNREDILDNFLDISVSDY